MTGAALSERWNVYLESLRQHAHQLLVWAYQDVRARIHVDLDEPAITGLLCEAMKERLDRPDTPDAYDHYCVGDQTPVSVDGRLGNDRLRLDMSVILANGRPRLEYVFEAKRLRTSGFPISLYTGAGGMGDFIECRYAQNCPEAAMIGLFQNRDLKYWHSELSRVFKADAESTSPRLGVRAHPAPVEVLPELLGVLESNHMRTNQAPIRLLHVFLDCT
jgi:hypothetical protein